MESVESMDRTFTQLGKLWLSKGYASGSETVEFSNMGYKHSKDRERYVKLIAEGKKELYKPETHSDLMSYNSIIWSITTLVAFFFAVIFIALALFEKVIPIWIWTEWILR